MKQLKQKNKEIYLFLFLKNERKYDIKIYKTKNKKY